MRKMKNGTIQMVVSDCLVTEFDDSRNIRGHLVYGPEALSGPMAHFMGTEYDGYIALERSARTTPINPRELNKSLKAAYRKSVPFGRINPFLTLPLEKLRGEYKRYAEDFVENRQED